MSELKDLRIEKKMTQKEVADWCNCTERYIGMVEAGKEIPTEDTQKAILNCIYGIGKPLPKVPKANSKKAKEDKQVMLWVCSVQSLVV